MDNGPFGRTPRQSPQRRPAPARPEPAAPQPAAQPVAAARDEAVMTRPQPVVTKTTSGKKPAGMKWLIGAVIGLVVIGAGIFGWMQLRGGSTMGIDSDKYQAVFLTSGQVYFGKLGVGDSDSFKLTDVYYVHTQSEETTEGGQAADSEGSAQLIKRGNEVHGPEDVMVISKNQVIFFENLKSDSQVSQKIDAFKKSQ